MGATGKVAGEDRGVGAVDGRMDDVARCGKHRLRDGAQRPEAATAQLGPALPAALEPPVVLVRNERDAARFADANEFARKQEIAAEAEVMRPDQTIAGLRSGE